MTPQQQLDAFMAKYSPEIRALAKAAVARLRKRLPGAAQLVYDNYNALVVAFANGERTSNVFLSIALYPRWVSLFFAEGVHLPDPQKLLKGSGTRVRHIVLADASDVDSPAVEALIAAAIKRKPIDTAHRGPLIVKMIANKQRPRRPSA